MNSSTPTFSVVIPLYDQSESIQRSLDSVLRQGYTNFEIIVVDDGSTDGGGDLVAAINDSRVRLVTQNNQGVSAARNRGIREAHGGIVAFLDADDEWYPDFLETIVALADRFPECSVYATSYLMKDDDGNDQLPLMRRFPALDTNFIFTNYFDAASVSSPPIWTSAVAVEKSALEQIGCFPDDIKSGEEDLVTWARLYARFEIAYSPFPKSIYRKWSLSWKHDKRIPEVIDLAGQGLRTILLNPKVPDGKKVGLRRYIGLWKKIRASHWIALGNRAQAFAAISQSLWYYPWNLKVWLYIPFLLLPSWVRDRLVDVVEKNVDQGRGRI